LEQPDTASAVHRAIGIARIREIARPATVEALRGRPLDSLLASFGDRRPSVEPVIGVGDRHTAP
jgi:hypothetical protein